MRIGSEGTSHVVPDTVGTSQTVGTYNGEYVHVDRIVGAYDDKQAAIDALKAESRRNGGEDLAIVRTDAEVLFGFEMRPKTFNVVKLDRGIDVEHASKLTQSDMNLPGVTLIKVGNEDSLAGVGRLKSPMVLPQYPQVPENLPDGIYGVR